MNEINAKTAEIIELKQFIEMNINDPIKLKDSIIKSFEEKLSNSIKMVNKLSGDLIEGEDYTNNLKSRISLLKDRINELVRQNEEKDLSISQKEAKTAELNKEISDLVEENGKLKYYLDTSINKLKQAYVRQQYLETRNNEIEILNSNLAVRAASGYDNLTPRPSFLGIENIIKEPPKSTREKVKKIIEIAIVKSKPDEVLRKKKPGLTITVPKTPRSHLEHDLFSPRTPFRIYSEDR